MHFEGDHEIKPNKYKSEDEAAVFDQESTVSSWDEDYYHPIAVKYYNLAIHTMLREMGVAAGDRVLDAGCGPGVHSIRAAKFGCNVTAMDLSRTMLSHAKMRAEAAGVIDRISFLQGDITNPSFETDFEFVFSWGVIIHVPETLKALDGLASVVRRDGILALEILNASSLDFKLEKLLRRILFRPFSQPVETSLGLGNWYKFGDERLWVIRFDMQSLDKEMEARGFKLQSRRTAEFTELQRRLPDFLRRQLLKLNSWMYRRKIGTSLSATQIVIYKREK